jgi:hypothetical protein
VAVVNIAIGTAILAWLLIGCALILIDVWQECRYQTELAEHEELLDRLWDDGPPRAENLEAVQPIRGTEAS